MSVKSLQQWILACAATVGLLVLQQYIQAEATAP